MRQGFSLLEVVIALGFLAILIVPITQVFTMQSNETALQDDQIYALQTATALMEEISAKAFQDPQSLPNAPTPSFGTRDDRDEITSNRTTWDDLDDYDGWISTENAATASIRVTYLTPPSGTSAWTPGITDNPTDFKCVSINVTYGLKYNIELSRVYSNPYNPVY